MLYLRVPHFHGSDARVLQQALNTLGFACGAVDGIFGGYTEHAVREFQRNVGLPADGIVGPETVRSLMALRHVWEGKEPKAHSEARIAPARAAEVLSDISLAVGGIDAAGSRVARRIVNLASATTVDSSVSLVDTAAEAPADARLVLLIGESGTTSALSGRPVVTVPSDTLAARLVTATATNASGRPEVIVELGSEVVGDEREEQRSAVSLLDAACALYV
jgi:lysozyme family protein